MAIFRNDFLACAYVELFGIFSVRNGHGVLGKRGRDDSSRLLFGAWYCKTWNRQETFGVRRVGED